SKLSKRQGSVAVEEYIAKGYLPEALINFLAMLGWNPGTTQELFSLPELIDAFEIDRIQKSGAIFDIEKLDWIQGQWIRRLAPEEFAARIKPLVEAKYSDATSDKDFVEKAKLIQDRLLFFPEAPEMLSFLYEEPAVDKDMLASEKQKVTKEILPEILQSLVETLESVSDWSLDNIKAALEKSLVTSTYKKGQILWPLRVALTGKPFSPGAYEVAAVLGRGATLKRLRKVL
ncbi:MAG TPA: glutamate--tRNA ligase family protein, partial [Candidatus Peribacteraceae bacterium]|nr:glutamate--tRNA ligase family protein [Candidatus Peribacteraceae bacterium]